MREIKFRAWDEDTNIMREVIDLFTKGQIVSYADPNSNRRLGLLDNFNLMQYTGLHDKNGKEIYEGDIVQDVVTHAKYKIIYKVCCFVLVHTKIGDSIHHNLYFSEQSMIDWEVIGNIYENSDLISE